MPITGRARLVGVMGWPVAHSLSPAMHNAAFQALGLDWLYAPFAVPPQRLADAARGLAALGAAGTNVTIPHKLAVMDLVDEVSPAARAIGAANTLVFGARVFADNTDWRGFLRALADVGCDPTGRRCFVLGAGGAARSIVYALASVQAETLVFNRSVERAAGLVADLGAAFPHAQLRSLPYEALPDEAARRPGLIVNTTSLGMVPRVETSPWPGGVPIPADATVYDLVYNPLATRFLREAKAAGARAVDGLGMLVHQGAIAFEMWTGVQPPTDVMYKACLAYL